MICVPLFPDLRSDEEKCGPLPQDILIEIFLLLPIQTLVRCKLVSKEWKNLIKDPKFTSLYLNKSTGFVLSNKSMAFILSKDKLHCLFFRDDVENTINSFKVSRGVRITSDKCRQKTYYYPHTLLLGSNKLVACVLTADSHFIYYNLVSGDSYEVKDAPLREKYQFQDRSRFSYGFGYDPRDDDYKIVVVCLNESLLAVYSFRNRGWKSFKRKLPHDKYRRGVSYHFYRRQFFESYSLNGLLYWIMRIREEDKQVMVALDLHTYELVEMALPTIRYDNYTYSITAATLTELDGQLCYWNQTLEGFGMWVMKDYGGHEYSWKMLLRIRPCQMRVPHGFEYRTTVTIVGTNILMYAYHGKDIRLLFRYDLIKGVLRSFKSSFKKLTTFLHCLQ